MPDENIEIPPDGGNQGGEQPPQNPPPEQGFSGLLNDNGEFIDNWTDKLPEGLREEASLKNFKTFEGMTKSLVNAQKMIGSDKVPVPNDNWDEEQWNDFYNKIGRPETPENYEFTRPEIPEGMNYNEDMEKAFASQAHNLGLTQPQASKLLDWYNKSQIDMQSELEKKAEFEQSQAVEALKKEWGKVYSDKMEKANAAVRTFGAADTLEKAGYANNPDMVKLFAKVGESISEDKLVQGRSDMSPADAKGKINSIMGDSKHPYHNAGHPGHKQAVEEVKNLYEMMHPSEE